MLQFLVKGQELSLRSVTKQLCGGRFTTGASLERFCKAFLLWRSCFGVRSDQRWCRIDAGEIIQCGCHTVGFAATDASDGETESAVPIETFRILSLWPLSVSCDWYQYPTPGGLLCGQSATSAFPRAGGNALLKVALPQTSDRNRGGICR